MLQGLADATTVCEQTSEEIQNNLKRSIKKTNPKLFTSKVSSTKKKKSVTRKDNKRFKTMVAVSQDRRIDLDSIGKYQIGDDSALSEENGEIPFLNQSKSLVVYDYLKKRCPNAFSDISERPVNVDTVVIDAEAELFVAPRDSEFTFKEAAISTFTNKFAPEFRRCDNLQLS